MSLHAGSRESASGWASAALSFIVRRDFAAVKRRPIASRSSSLKCSSSAGNIRSCSSSM